MMRKTSKEILERGIQVPKPDEIPLAKNYVPTGLPCTEGKMFIEVFGQQILDAPLFTDRCAAALPRPPKHGTKLLANSVLMGLELLHLSRAVYPTPNLGRLNNRVLEILASGYVVRHPFKSRDFNWVVYTLSTSTPDQIRTMLRRPKAVPPLGLMVRGVSGMGKTFGLEYVLGLIDQVWQHNSPDGKFEAIQVVWLHVECPPTGSLKALLLNILLELDKVVGTTYYVDWLNSRYSTDVILINVALILYNHNLGLLVLDELQHLAARGLAETDANLNFFVSLMNFLCLPIISVGTHAAEKVLTGRMRDGRRLSSAGSIEFRRYGRHEAIMTSLHNYYLKFLPNTNERPVTPELEDSIYDVHQGLQFLIPNLVHRCSVECSYRGERFISSEILKYYREVELAPIGRALDALASNDPDQLAQFDDLMSTKAIETLRQHQKGLDEKKPTGSAGVASAARHGNLYRTDADFPSDHLTFDQINAQCDLTASLVGTGDLYSSLKQAGHIAAALPYGRWDV